MLSLRIQSSFGMYIYSKRINTAPFVCFIIQTIARWWFIIEK